MSQDIAHGNKDSLLLLSHVLIHRLNNQLTIILGQLDLVLEHPDLPSVLRPRVETAIEGTEGAAREVLAFHKALRDPERSSI